MIYLGGDWIFTDFENVPKNKVLGGIEGGIDVTFEGGVNTTFKGGIGRTRSVNGESGIP